MAEKTGIQWTDHTANFWWGCMKVSPGCANCYAEAWSKRYGRAIWGPAATTTRWRTKGPWRDILRWDAKAAADGVRRRVFAQSMSDFFEEHPQLDEWRAEACEILAGLKHLDVQLLTKRPENIRRMVPDEWLTAWPSHIWIGTSVENQEQANKRIRHLLASPAAIHFLSCEPLLGEVDLIEAGALYNGAYPSISWVIAGGESGPKARLPGTGRGGCAPSARKPACRSTLNSGESLAQRATTWRRGSLFPATSKTNSSGLPRPTGSTAASVWMLQEPS